MITQLIRSMLLMAMLLTTGGGLYAAVSSNGTYILKSAVIASGGGASSLSGSYQSLAVVGQSGLMVFNGTHQLYAGFLSTIMARANFSPVPLDDSYGTLQDEAITTGNVLANDTDPDGDALTITLFDASSSGGGTVSYNGNGTFNYTPLTGYSGADTFTYTVVDGFGGSAAATVTINVSALNQIEISPVIPNHQGQNYRDMRVGDSLTFHATGVYANGTHQSLDGKPGLGWTSNAAAVTIVSGTGAASAVSAGAATLTATLGITSASVSVTVVDTATAALTSIEVTPQRESIASGGSENYRASGLYSDGSRRSLNGQVTWSSSVTGVATISPAGLATTVGTGTTNITATLGAVSGSTALAVTAAAVTSRELTPQNESLAAGFSRRYRLKVAYSDGERQDVSLQSTWASSNPLIATVDATGLVTAVGAGAATITATYNGVPVTATVTVTAATLASLEIGPLDSSIEDSMTIAQNMNVRFYAKGTYSDGTHKYLTTAVTWSSSAPTVAIIGNAWPDLAMVRGVAAGTTTITASLNGISATASLTVSNVTLSRIEVTAFTASVPLSLNSRRFRATGIFSDNSKIDLTPFANWSTGDPTIAIIGNAYPNLAIAQGVAAGATTVTASYAGFTDTATLTINNQTLTGLTVSPANATVVQGLTQSYRVTGSYSDGTNSSIWNVTPKALWTSTLPGVATVSNSPLFSTPALGVSAGTTVINADDPTGTYNGNVNLTVSAAALTSTALNATTLSLIPGKSQSLRLTATYADGVTQNVNRYATWTTDTPAVATVINGRIKAVGAGTAIISASYGGGVAQTATVTVTAATLSSIAITTAPASINAGATKRFRATGAYSDGSSWDMTNDVTWISDNTAAVKIGNGIGSSGSAYGVATGTANITATYKGVTSTAVTVSVP